VYQCLSPALDAFNLGFAIIDRRCRYVTANRALAQMNNFPQQAHPGKPLHAVLGSLSRTVETLVDGVFSTGVPFDSIQLSGRLPKRPDRSSWTEYFFPIRDKRGRVVHVGVCVKERKSAFRMPRALDSMPNLAHEKRRDPGNYPALRGLARQSEVAIFEMSGTCLSVREREVLGLMALGHSSKEISSMLAISVNTSSSCSICNSPSDCRT
jgi:hypothetical protein